MIQPTNPQQHPVQGPPDERVAAGLRVFAAAARFAAGDSGDRMLSLALAQAAESGSDALRSLDAEWPDELDVTPDELKVLLASTADDLDEAARATEEPATIYACHLAADHARAGARVMARMFEGRDA